ncbi:hypothetical protein [Hoeflea sp.]|uniref:hypothetical protein n=1 Tax=Hoeflea sp. TaxID=1940281 RepID=UPI003B02B023
MSDGTFPHNLTEIDELTRRDHSYLLADDRCYFLGEYTARKGYGYSGTNQLIFNLKKPMNKRGTSQWVWKGRAIIKAARALQSAIPDEWLDEATFVPIPPSKARDHPLYDDRMTQVLTRITPTPNVCDCILQGESTDAAHELDNRPGPDDIAGRYGIDRSHCVPDPTFIVLCDDVLTTGAHYKGAQMIINGAFPGVPVAGIFIARRVPETIDLVVLFGDDEDEV